MNPRPFPQSYWVRENLFCAGHYPGDLDDAVRDAKLNGLLDCGIRRVLSLMEEDELSYGGQPFEPYLDRLQGHATRRGVAIECLRISIRDATAPPVATMKHILDTIDQAVRSAVPIYVHCWGGHGRTSTVVACHLARHGTVGQAAIDRVLRWRSELPKQHDPYEIEQRQFVLRWQAGE